MRYILALIAIFSLTACPSGPGAADCDYEIYRVKAEVVKIAKIEEAGPRQGHYNVSVEFSGSPQADYTHSLADLLEMDTDTAFMTANKIYVGNKYYVDISERTAGNCDSLHISFDHQFRTGHEE